MKEDEVKVVKHMHPVRVHKKHEPESGSVSVLARYQKVISVLVKYGFEDLMSHPPLRRLVPESKALQPFRQQKSVLDFTRWERIRMVCEELGTTFIKFAQIASNRPDLLPEELIMEFEKLQDHAPPVAEADIRATLMAELPKPVEELFEFVDYNPIASASIAQVHRARLIGGKEVILKVQRPGIRHTIEQDIAILKSIAQIIEDYFPDYGAYQPMELVKVFESSIRKELKFTQEAVNVRRFANNFKGNQDIYVPDVYAEASTEKVLCMEYISGYKITDRKGWQVAGISGSELAVKGLNLYFEQIFEHGFFHADPHPGNVFLMPDGKICFIDYGMMGTIIESDKELLADLLLAVHNEDVQELKKALKRFAPDYSVPDEKALEYDIVDFFAEYKDRTLEDIEGEEFIEALNALFFRYKIRIPPNLFLLLKALVIIEGVGLNLDPAYNIVNEIEPFIRRLMAKKYDPIKIGTNLLKSAGDFSRMAKDIPEDTKAILQKIKEGKLHVEFEHQGLEKMYNKMEIITNRMAFTLIIVAMILGSSLIIIADVPPHYHNVPVLGYVGYTLAAMLGIRLAYSIFRHGKF